jgi:hypothetical protein
MNFWKAKTIKISEMKTTKTYLQGCSWCNAEGSVPSKNYGMGTTPFTYPCPVCNGAKAIVVTEITEDSGFDKDAVISKQEEYISKLKDIIRGSHTAKNK